MNKKLINTAILCAAAALSQHAAAEGSYFGIGLSLYDLELDPIEGVTLSGDSKVIEGYYGFEINEYFAAEARLGFGLGDGDLEGELGGYSATIGDYKISSMYGLYAKPQIKANGFKAYALLGYAGYNSDVSVSDGEADASESGSDSGFSYGVGAGWDFGQHGVSLEWKTTKIDGGDVSGLAFFYQYNF